MSGSTWSSSSVLRQLWFSLKVDNQLLSSPSTLHAHAFQIYGTNVRVCPIKIHVTQRIIRLWGNVRQRHRLLSKSSCLQWYFSSVSWNTVHLSYKDMDRITDLVLYEKAPYIIAMGVQTVKSYRLSFATKSLMYLAEQWEKIHWLVCEWPSVGSMTNPASWSHALPLPSCSLPRLQRKGAGMGGGRSQTTVRGNIDFPKSVFNMFTWTRLKLKINYFPSSVA